MNSADFDIIEFRSRLRRSTEQGDDYTIGRKVLVEVGEFERLFPNSIKSLCLKGDAFSLLDFGSEDAVAAYKLALSRDPLAAEAYEALGKIYEIAGEYDMAGQMFRCAIAAEQRVDSYVGLVNVLLEEKRVDEAKQVFRDVNDYLHAQTNKLLELENLFDRMESDD